MASKLISRDSYMCELRRFFSLFFEAYLATKFLILMEFEAVEPAWTLHHSVNNGYTYESKAVLKFYVPFLN